VAKHAVSGMPWKTDRRNNPVRVIDVFVEELDLAGLGLAGSIPSNWPPSYHPSALLKLYIYGYLNRFSRADA